MRRGVALAVLAFAVVSAAFFAGSSVAASRADCTPDICNVTLQSPANGATIAYTPGMTLTFTWIINFYCGDPDPSQCEFDFPVEVRITTDQSLQNVVQDKYAGYCTPNCPQQWTSLPFTSPGTYYWQVTTRGGSNVNPVSAVWAFTLKPAAPVVRGFSPTSGKSGTSVTLSGSGFSGASAVRFNGVGAAFTVNSDSQITTTVPAGATSGPISVTTPNGTAQTPGSFTVQSSTTGGGGKPVVSRWGYTEGGPRAGTQFLLEVQVVNSSTGAEITSGKVSCQAYVGTSLLLIPVSSKFEHGFDRFVCRWNIPADSAGKHLKASMKVRAKGRTVSSPVYRHTIAQPPGPTLVFPIKPAWTVFPGGRVEANQSARLQFANGSQVAWNAKGGTGSCAAHVVGGGSLPAGTPKYYSTGLKCVWQVPAADRGKSIVFVMTLHALGQTRSSSFTAHVS